MVAAVPRGIPVILDAKRGDIGSTAQAYATAAFNNTAAATDGAKLNVVPPTNFQAARGLGSSRTEREQLRDDAAGALRYGLPR